MRWKISPRGHDPRQIDLLAIIALTIIIAVIGHFLIATPKAHVTSFIEPSQTVRW